MSAVISNLLFPNVEDYTVILSRYPDREGNPMVTRIAPSPTGFLHIGSVYTGLLNEKLAHQAGGKFLVRIEDTDQARNTTDFENQRGGIYSIIEGLNFFELDYDEGVVLKNDNSLEQKGDYGPYIQSQRLDIYKSFVKYLLETGKAYVCFLTTEELESIRASQQVAKQATGIYGSYALSRNLTEAEVIVRINKGDAYVIRWKANGEIGKKIQFEDGVKGNVDMQENYIDQIILKSDGFPSYALAHIIDDYLMGTTHVIRADEWLASVPYHIQLFQGFAEILSRPQWSYNHNSPIEKMENGNRRKLSKRKDPEADVKTLIDAGYPAEGIKTYLMCLLNSNFEERWKEENTNHPYISYKEFQVSLDKCSKSGAIFDMDKLNHICAEYLAVVSLDQLIQELESFSKNNEGDKEYLKNILNFDRVKKLHTTYQNISEYILPFVNRPAIDFSLYPSIFSADGVKNILSQYSKHLDEKLWGDTSLLMTKEERFEDLKQFGKQFGIAPSNGEFKEGGYIGKIGDLAMLLRLHLYGSTNTPDIYEMIRVMGKDTVSERLK